MADANRCPECGFECPSDAPAGLCPVCLLQHGLERDADNLDLGGTTTVTVVPGSKQHAGNPEWIRRFVEEAQIAGQLQHPGIVPVYDLGAFGDRRPYFTMKLLKGRTLADLLAARPDPAADQPHVLGIFLQVCQTVAYAHARGVIHRDLKPPNVMVGSAGVQERLRAAELARAAESARALEAQARAAIERSRRRRTIGLAAALVAMLTLAGSTVTYIGHLRQARSAAIERLPARATALLDEARARRDDPVRWRTARTAVQQVEDDSTGITPEAQDRLTRFKNEVDSALRDAEADATLRQALVDIRANQQDAGPEATDEAYAAAFRAAGLDLDSLGVTELADRLKRRTAAVVVELAAYLDHWSEMRRTARRPDVEWWRKPLELARAVDPDDYRARLRALLKGDNRKAQIAQLEALVNERRAADLPAATAVLLGLALEAAGNREASVGLLRQTVARHPDDVWVNFALARALRRMTAAARDETVRYYTAARALRPETAHDLAHLLDAMGRGAEAQAIFRDLVIRRPDTPWHLACLGRCRGVRRRSQVRRRTHVPQPLSRRLRCRAGRQRSRKRQPSARQSRASQPPEPRSRLAQERAGRLVHHS